MASCQFERRLVIPMRFLLLMLCSGFLCLNSEAQKRDEFVLVKKDGPVSIYERWIIFPKSDPPVEAREVKGEFAFNNSIYAGLRLLQSEKLIQKWQSHVSEFKVYKQADTTQWLEYSYHDIPWPVSDQDHFLQYTVEQSKPGVLFVTFESVVNNEKAPVRKGVSRMKLSGSWTFEQVTPTQVKTTYLILSSPLNFPKFLTDPIIRSNMMSTIEKYVSILEHKK
jgi:hypothetical protein